jgi:hypothetical protein
MIRLSKYFYLFPIILTCFFLSVDKYVLQSAVDGGLILSGLVKFPENFSNITSTYYNSYTILHYFTLILLKINFSVDSISIILTFIIISFYTLGIFYLTLGITKSHNLALLLCLYTIINRLNFGDADYPVLFYAEHTFGAFSLSAFTFIVGLLANKNFKIAGLITSILLSSHVIVGLWTILLFIIIYFIHIFFLKNKKNNIKKETKKLLLGFFIWLIPIILSLFFFSNNLIDKSYFDLKDFDTYMSLWDHHRNLTLIRYDYIYKTLFLLILIIIYSYYFRQKENLIFILFILLSCLGSLVIHLFYKIVPNYYIPQFLISSMPTRLFVLHSVLGYPLIISIIFFILKHLNFRINLNLKNYKILFIVTTIIIILSLSFNSDNFSHKTKNFYTNKVEKRFLNFLNTLFKKNLNDDAFFWQKISEINTDGYFVTTWDSSGPALRYGRKPHIINTTFIDTIAYFPYQATETKLILENIYGISFEDPPIKFLAAIIDTWFKDIFEKRTSKKWNEISKKYNISGVIVPSDWNLSIENKIESQNYTAYILE